MTHDVSRIELWWLPLGAGGWFVRFNGRVYEALRALRERRRPLDLYHSALVVWVPEGRFVVENCWPIPDGEGAGARGVAVEGAVASEWIGRFTAFRYEVRCWRDGVIADAGAAVASPQVLSRDLDGARRLLGLVGELPRPVWGRDELGTGEMWNSNSVIAWLLVRAGLAVEAIRPPAGGRAPGWAAGVAVARRQQGLPGPRSMRDSPGLHSTRNSPSRRSTNGSPTSLGKSGRSRTPTPGRSFRPAHTPGHTAVSEPPFQGPAGTPLPCRRLPAGRG